MGGATEIPHDLGVAVVVFIEQDEGEIRIIGARVAGKRESGLCYSKMGYRK